MNHACRLLILTITIFEINLILENYSQKTLLKFYNENLKNRNLTPSVMFIINYGLIVFKIEFDYDVYFFF
ncbi:hypothetical protein [Borreliella burgdorferi]|uniref:hypothetical protein n=1 Tax=Borreliella burgdorferi TaxID=139 RepID=UPI0012FF25F2|nr:hypothetical protein [Borreliella burgdorferi]